MLLPAALALSLAVTATPAPAVDSPPAGAPHPTAPSERPPPESPGRDAVPLPANATPPPSKEVLPRGAVLEEISGTVRDVDRKAHRLAVESAAGAVTLSLDRNTMVYTSAGLATVLDVRPGVRIRAGRNADFLAYWVQVLDDVKVEPQSTPGQGTGPAGGGSAPAGESSGPGTGAASPPTTVPGGAAPGGARGGGPGR